LVTGKLGRFDLFDESLDLLSGCATRRVVALHPTTCIKLLTQSIIELCSDEISCAHQLLVDECEDKWLARWGKSTIKDMCQWESGAVIIATPLLGEGSQNCFGSDNLPSMFLSCSLHKKSSHNELSRDRLEILADDKIVNSRRRILMAQREKIDKE